VGLQLFKSNSSLNNQAHNTGLMYWILGNLRNRDVLDNLS